MLLYNISRRLITKGSSSDFYTANFICHIIVHTYVRVYTRELHIFDFRYKYWVSFCSLWHKCQSLGPHLPHFSFHQSRFDYLSAFSSPFLRIAFACASGDAHLTFVFAPIGQLRARWTVSVAGSTYWVIAAHCVGPRLDLLRFTSALVR